jgi:hypothetical protein
MLASLVYKGFNPNVAEFGLLSCNYMGVEPARLYLEEVDHLTERKIHAYLPTIHGHKCAICELDSDAHRADIRDHPGADHACSNLEFDHDESSASPIFPNL